MRNNLSPGPKRPEPRLPRGIRIYAIGDVHGRADLLNQAIARIDADAVNSHPTSEIIEVFLGDYIDRGPNSRQVIDLLLTRDRRRRAVFLAGNHELFLLEFLKNPAVLDHWKRYGALATLRSYGIRVPKGPELSKQSELALALCKQMPSSHRNFLETLKPFFVCGDFFFVHAGVRPGVPLMEQNLDDLLWIRKEFLFHDGDYGKIIVHGHTPVLKPDVRANRINIDTGAYASGNLTCLRLESDEVRFI